MKKILFTIFFVALLLSLSVTSFAISNEYTFSNVWNKSVFSKSYVIANNNSYQSDIISAPMLILNNGSDDINLGFNETVSFSGIDFDSARASIFDVEIPLGIYLSQYNELDVTYYLLLPGEYSDTTIQATAVTSTGTSISIPLSTSTYSSGELQSITYNSFGGIDSTNSLYSADSVIEIKINYEPSSNVTIDYINFNVNFLSSIGSFIFGAFGSTELTVLPDSIEYHLLEISSKLNLTNQRILSLINELRATNEKIDEILSSLADSSASSTVINNYLQNPSSEQQQVTLQLTQLVEEAKSELEEIKEVLTSVPAPTFTDVVSSNTDGIDYSQSVLDDDQTKQLFGDIFDKLPFLSGIILGVLALASVGYILYGKK